MLIFTYFTGLCGRLGSFGAPYIHSFITPDRGSKFEGVLQVDARRQKKKKKKKGKKKKEQRVKLVMVQVIGNMFCPLWKNRLDFAIGVTALWGFAKERPGLTPWGLCVMGRILTLFGCCPVENFNSLRCCHVGNFNAFGVLPVCAD